MILCIDSHKIKRDDFVLFTINIVSAKIVRILELLEVMMSLNRLIEGGEKCF